MNNADVMKALLAEKDRLEKQYKDQKIEAKVTINTVKMTVEVEEKNKLEEKTLSITKAEAGKK